MLYKISFIMTTSFNDSTNIYIWKQDKLNNSFLTSSYNQQSMHVLWLSTKQPTITPRQNNIGLYKNMLCTICGNFTYTTIKKILPCSTLLSTKPVLISHIWSALSRHSFVWVSLWLILETLQHCSFIMNLCNWSVSSTLFSTVFPILLSSLLIQSSTKNHLEEIFLCA